MYIHSNEIKLRKIEQSDLLNFYQLKQESWESTHRITICNMEDQKKWFEKLESHVHFPINLILVAEHNDISIGDYKINNINWISRSTDVGWDVFLDQRNKGYGKKIIEAGNDFCFNVLNLNRLNAEILDNNIKSQKCAEFNNFKKEGFKEQAVFINGIYVNSILYGKLKNG